MGRWLLFCPTADAWAGEVDPGADAGMEKRGGGGPKWH